MRYLFFRLRDSVMIKEKCMVFFAINRHRNQPFSFRVIFKNRILNSSLGPGQINRCNTIILNDTIIKSTNTLTHHDQHHDMFWVVPCMLLKLSRIVKIIHKGSVILSLKLIKHQQDSSMNIRNIFFNVFIQKCLILKVKLIYKTTVANII